MADLLLTNVGVPILSLFKLHLNVLRILFITFCSVLLEPTSLAAVDNQKISLVKLNHQIALVDHKHDSPPLWKDDDVGSFHRQGLQNKECFSGTQMGNVHNGGENSTQLAFTASKDSNWETIAENHSELELDGSLSKISVTKDGSSIQSQSGPACSYKQIDLTQSPAYRYALTHNGAIANATSYIPPGIPVFDVTITNMCQCCCFANIRVACGRFSSAILVNPNTFKMMGINNCLVNNGGELGPQDAIYFQYATTKEYNLVVIHAEACNCLRQRC